jgi:hypothetical protein
MSSVKEKAFANVIKTLDALGCQYAIIDQEGNKHGTLAIEEEKQKRRVTVYPLGEIRNHIRPYVDDMKVGEVREVPYLEYGYERIRSNIGAWFIAKNGTGSCTTTINKEKGVVEVLRIA